MTDAHENTPSKGHGRIDLQPDYDKYGVCPRDDSTVILRVDSDKHLFKRAGLIRYKDTGVVLKEYVENESLEGEACFKTVESISGNRDTFQQQLRDGILNVIHAGEVSDEKAEELADALAKSSGELFEQP
jgi:hypothetical protein